MKNLQYISDDSGETTGVLVPISEWRSLMLKLPAEEKDHIPDWQIEESKKRISAIKNGTSKPRLWADAQKDVFVK